MPRDIAKKIGEQVTEEDLPEPVREAVPDELLATVPPELLLAVSAELGIQILERAVVPLLKRATVRRALTYSVAVGGAALALKLLADYIREEEGEIKALPEPEPTRELEPPGRKVPIE